MRRLSAALFLFLVVVGSGIAFAAPVPPPGDSDAPVAVPEPSEKALRWFAGGNKLWALDTLLGVLVPGAILFSGLSARIRDVASRIGRRWYFTIAIYFILFTLLTTILYLPLTYFEEFVRPHAYGLSNQTFAKWAGDTIKGLLVSLVVGSLVIWGPYKLLERSPKRWWLYTSLLAVPVIVFFMVVAPVWIDPLFNDFGPMKDHDLEARILALADRAGIEGGRVYEVDKSVDTETVNAYVTGFGATKRIVLWDTRWGTTSWAMCGRRSPWPRWGSC